MPHALSETVPFTVNITEICNVVCSASVIVFEDVGPVAIETHAPDLRIERLPL